MVSLIEKRKNILKIFYKNNNNVLIYITELEKLMKIEKFSLYELNNGNFDVLVEAIKSFINYNFESSNDYCKVVDYIISQCNYKTLNYTISGETGYIVPLFLAIYKGQFKIADLLISKASFLL
ncbi:hypothetical protein U3516DRAFT_48230 [Neocallimastix sp. 'constans']